MNPATDPWQALRSTAAARATAIGLPTRALEAWRYVDCAPLAQDPPAGEAPAIAVQAGSTGWSMNPLNVDDNSQRWTDCLATADDIGAVWSLSHLRDGLHLNLGAKQDGHIHLVIDTPMGWHGRRLRVTLEREARGTMVIEHRLGAARSCTGIEVDAAPGSHLIVEEIQSGSNEAQLLSNAWLRLERDANVTWTSAWRGGTLVRPRLKAKLLAAGAELDFAGLARIDGTRQAHQYLRVEHLAGDTRSQQLVKNVIDGTARASFDGLIHVAKGADRSDAQQTNHNLLLAPGGRADTRPQLDIHADEVKAAHGATVGRPEDEQVIYLRTRGLALATARQLVQQGFSDEILHRFRHVQP